MGVRPPERARTSRPRRPGRPRPLGRPEHGGAPVTGPRPAVQWSVDVDRIERARVLNAWTRTQLASVAHVDPKTLSDMCNRRRQPMFATVQAVCAAPRLAVPEVILFADDVQGGHCLTFSINMGRRDLQ